MSETNQERDNGRPRGRSLLKWVGVVGLVIVVTLVGINHVRPTAEEELAAFEADRAIPNRDNAALLYAALLRGEEIPSNDLEVQLTPLVEGLMDPMSLEESRTLGRKLVELELPKGLLDPNDEERTLLQSWTSAEYPGLGQWLDERQDHIDQLLRAAQRPVCCFPLRPGPNDMGLFDMPLGTLAQYALLLRRAANNDMGEGRIAAGLTKYQALTSVGRHLQMQPSVYALLAGIVHEGTGLQHLAEFIATGPASDRHLNILAADGNNLENRWEALSEDVIHVRDILARTLKDRRRLDIRMYAAYRRIHYEDEGWTGESRTHDLYRRVLCQRRAHHILIALRRFKNLTGYWPQELNVIALDLPPLALVDPQNDRAFVYERTGDGFRLYSTGPDGRDENGQRQFRGEDDWPIWPSYITLARQGAAAPSPRRPLTEADKAKIRELAQKYGEEYQKNQQ